MPTRLPDGQAGALAPLIRPLPEGECDGSGRWITRDLGEGMRLIASLGAVPRDAWRRIAEEATPSSSVVSRSAAAGCHVLLVASEGCVGIDLETLDRIAMNALPTDPWLAPAERVLVDAAANPVLELGCHWVLKEAYGKALGVGLALPLDALAFGSLDGTIMLQGAAAPAPDDRWRFILYRDDDRVLGVACRPTVQAAMPLAPAGRNPPTPLLDR